MPDRGHCCAWHQQTGKLVAFARRPDNFAVLINGRSRTEPIAFKSPTNRHFYGHGVFSPDGRLLFAPENDWSAKRGVIGVYDMSDARAVHRIGEFPSYGIGPHEILWSEMHQCLVVANGGILTHPDRRRQKLNIASMAPNISFIDPSSGSLIAQHQLPAHLHQVSLRHMALDALGKVWVGGQYEGPEQDLPPLVSCFSVDHEPELLELPEQLTSSLNNYVGSVSTSKDGTVISTTCPRGNKVLFWETATKELIGTQGIDDGCGVAALGKREFLITDGSGTLRYVHVDENYLEVTGVRSGASWDNHLTAL
ncbi:DUF1513 domain-containing protein [Pseudovibrio flavus]|uniref:DUF1513 domain-containing protein n=1 Tax=Pseudovibrio flavus TaxID=2529854 RepID=UPI003529248E